MGKTRHVALTDEELDLIVDSLQAFELRSDQESVTRRKLMVRLLQANRPSVDLSENKHVDCDCSKCLSPTY